jgi:hypothetical protein
MAINSFPIQTKNVTGLSPILSSAGQTKIILISGTGAYLIDSNSLGSSGSITTGQADNRYYPLTGNPSGFVLSGELNTSGQFLYNLIGSSAAGVSTLNAASGNLLLTGTGNITVSRNGQTIIISGATGAYSNFVTIGDTGNFITNGMTGVLGNEFVRKSESGQFAASGNLTATGINLQNQLNVVSNWTGTTPSLFSNINHGHNYVTGIGVGESRLTGLVSLTGLGNVVVSTGISGIVQISGNTGAYANFVTPSQTGLLTNTFVLRSETGGFGAGGGAAGGVTSVGATGTTNTGYFTGSILVSGAGNVIASTGNQNLKVIVVSGDTGAYSNFVSLSQTGNVVNTSQTGGFLTLGNVGGVRNIQSTGAYPSGIVSGNIIVSGVGNISVTTGVVGQINISGDTGAYINFLTPSATGNFITNGMTGVLTGEFVRRNESGQFAASGNLTATGINLQNQINTHGHNYVTSLAATGITNTGLFTGSVMLSGVGNIVVSTGDNSQEVIRISGDTGAYINFLTPSSTGGFVNSTQTGLLTNVFYPLNTNPAGYITSSSNVGVRSLQTTGAFPSGIVSGNVVISGTSIISVTTGVNGTIVVSGNTGAYANFATQSQITLLSGGQAVIFDSGIKSGVVRQTFQFPITFNQPPFVFTQLKYLGNTGIGYPVVGISGVTTSGFSGVYSLPFSGTGYVLSIWATSGAIAGGGGGGGSSVQVTGLSISNPNFTGAGNVTVYTGGNNLVVVSGETGLLTNVFYPLSSNPAGYITSSAAGVTSLTATGSINSGLLTGVIRISGAGNVTASTGASNSIILSGDTGAYSTFALKSDTGQFVTTAQTGGLVSSANTGTFVTTGQTGDLINVFYPLVSNPAGYITSSSNVGVRIIVPTGTSQSGNISGNVIFTGAGNITTSTGISGHIVISGNTGAYANFVTLSQTGNVVNTSQTGGFASIQVTGSPLLSLVNLTGAGNVTVSTGANPLVIVSGNTGAYANFVTPSQTGIFVTTGQTGSLTNVFYPLNSNPSNYLTPSTVGGVRIIVPTGTTNSGSISGNVILTGAGNVSTFTGISGHIVVSGDTGAYSNFVTLSQTGGLVSSANTGIFVTTGQTGALTNVFYPLSSNPSNYLTSATVGGVRMIVPTGTTNSGNISGNVIVTGAGNVSIFTGISGHIVISGNTGAYANFVVPSQTGGFLDSSDTGNFVTTQESGLLTNVFYPLNSNPNNYLTVSSNVGVRTIIPTGTTRSGMISGNVIFTGAGNVTVETGISGDIVVSGNTGAYANFVTLSQTGNVVNTSQTGGFASIQVTGSPLLPLVNLTGIGNVTVTTGGIGGSLVTINGNTGAYANFVTLNQTGGFLTLGNVGGVRTLQTTGAFPSGIVSGNVVVSGAGTVNVTTGINGTIIVSGTSVAGPGGVAGVNSIAATGITNTGFFTGDVMFSGAGNIVVSTGTPLRKLIVVSGNTGAYSNFITPSDTGLLTNAFYPLTQNPSGYVVGQTGTGILDGQLLIGASGINGFQQGDLYGLTGIKVISGSGSLGVGIDVSKVVTGLVAGTNISVSNNGTGLWTINATQAGSSGINSIITTGYYPSGSRSGIVFISGAGNVSVYTGFNNSIVVSGAGGGGVAAGINTIGATGTTNTGYFTGDVLFSGAGNIVISTGNTSSKLIVVSGGTNTVNNLYTVANFSGLHKYWIPAAAMTPSQITGANTGQIFTQNSGHTIDTLNFSSGSGQSAYFNVSFPKVWDKTNVVPVFYWTTTGNVGTINWGIAGANIDDGNSLNIQYNQGETISDSTISGNYLHQTTGAPLNISGTLSDDDQVYFRVYRSAGGSLADESKLIGVGIGYYETGLNATPSGVTSITTTGAYPSGVARGDVVLTGIGTVAVTTGINGSIVISGTASAGPGGSAGVNSIAATGITNTGYHTGDVMFSGAGNVVVSTGTPLNKLIVVSGNTGAYSNFITPSQTGQFVTTTQTGGFLTTTSLNPYMLVTGTRDDGFAPLDIPFTIIKTGLVFTNTGKFRIYTVPSNLFLAPDSFELITKNVSGITTGAAFGVGSGTGFTSEFVSGYRMENTGTWGRGNFDMYTDIMTGGQNVNFNIYTGTTGAANTIHSGYFILRGTLYSGI